jgi:lysophospholipase L1-like esterase
VTLTPALSRGEREAEKADMNTLLILWKSSTLSTMRRSLFAAIAALALAVAAQPTPRSVGSLPWSDGVRVVFLGDSITQGGLFIEDVEAYLFTRFPDRRFDIINLGLSNETVSGSAEPDHSYSRPDVRQRLGRILSQARPDLVVVCYGMNDGIFHPPSPDRLAAYQRGIEEVVKRVKMAGAEVVLATPPPFDPKRIADRVQPIGAKTYGFNHPFEGYDEVLEEYSRWLLSKRADGWKVVDVHGEVKRFVTDLQALDPSFSVTIDGVHPNATGHWLIAQAFLKAWDAPSEVDSATIDAKTFKVTAGQVDSIVRDGPNLSLSWTTRIPMPRDPSWDVRLFYWENPNERFNRHRLTFSGMTIDQELTVYQLFEGDRRIGVGRLYGDLVGYPRLSTNRRAAELRVLVAERQRILAPAWLEAIGHGPPEFPKALPLDVAKKRANALEARIRELARPVPIHLRFEFLPGK